MEESSSKLDVRHHQIEASWVPSGPAKPGLETGEPIPAEKPEVLLSQDNWSQQAKCCEGSNSVSATRDSAELRANEATESKACGDAIREFNTFSMDNTETLPLRDLLAYVAADSRSPALAPLPFLPVLASSSLGNYSHLHEPQLHHIEPETPHLVNKCFPFDLNTPTRTVADATSAGISSKFAPITPDQIEKTDKGKASTATDLCMAVTAEDTEVHKEVTKSSDLGKIQSELCDIQSSATISTVTGENFEPEMGIDQQIDPSQTPVKKLRKKHRPKVIVEGQSKKTNNRRTPRPNGLKEDDRPKRKYVKKGTVSKPVDAPLEGQANKSAEEVKPSGSEDMPKSKRNYVRQKMVDQSMAPSQDGNIAATDFRAARVTRSSCRKSLNFDNEAHALDGRSSQLHLNLDTNNDIPAARVTRSSCRKSLNFDKETHALDGRSSQLHLNLETNNNILVSSSQQSRSTIELGQENIVLVEKTDVGIAHDLTQSMNHVLNDYHSVKESQAPCTSNSCMSSQPHGQPMVQNHDETTKGKCQIVFSDVTQDKEASSSIAHDVKRTTRSSSKSNYSSSRSLIRETQTRGSKRRRFSTTEESEPCNINAAGVYYNSMQAYQDFIPPNEYRKEETPSKLFPPIFKEKRTENFHTSGAFSNVPTHCNRFCTYPTVDPRTETFTSESAFHINKDAFKCFSTLGNGKKLTKKRSKVDKKLQNSLCENFRQWSTSSSNGKGAFGVSQGPHTSMEALAEICAMLNMEKQLNKTVVSSSSPIYNHEHYATNSMGSVAAIKSKNTCTIDAIIEQFNCLDLKGEQNALVTYQADYPWQYSIVVCPTNRAIVPTNNQFNQNRKQRPRPRVDLDDETNRVWKLLLLDINSEGIDGTDPQSTKWWEDERELFRKRTESFIARMHLVQGDRRFTPWRGSVVDSVIGVFLTQNVSDHLSSSAFLSMAARFPLKSSDHHNDAASCKERLAGQDALEWYESHVCTHGSMCDKKYYDGKFNELDVKGFGSQNIEMLGSSTEDQRELDDVFSSRNSVISPHNSVDSTGQTANKCESCSRSSIETEPTDQGACGSTSFVQLLHMTGKTMLHGIYSQRSSESTASLGSIPYSFRCVDLGNQDRVDIDVFEDSRHFDISKENEISVTDQSGLSAESSAGASCQEVQKFSSENSNSLNDHQITVEDKESELMSKVQNQENHKIYQEVNALNSSECVDNSSWNPSTSKAKRRKTNGKEEKDASDWDNLRKQAQANGKRERTAETMDSVDWEAVRCADVEEIAHTIKERGMNNILAERIKDFLNRMVREHESIDLEWLRDVHPDRAKEFLLSIRGLGLKSVECVRLLTLHHLAFPVDTNVGRIAVRLGWVPLQPLPESLQLHLLELYPVLESVQKFLWPRLCKLDQRTLYELHYQMITFGKVFCTKSKPNCNACPMRAECRHFASAYASARLALPAPEERSIISATENESANRNPAEKISHLRLPQPEANQQLETSSQVICPTIEVPVSPRIEEPETPEAEQIQAPEFDIEDNFHENADEIPTIKLNLEQLNRNLQNYVQQNILVPEGEMSKALVVLNPEAASIPMPKLKNISRLRTEHQVYELPDTHPLLQGFDRREQDDPSPYLLAIWTPGETVDSIQPPKSSCGFQESGRLCDQETCFSCNSIREANLQTVRGTVLIPCRTAMRGSFPLNGTYFQVNEMFADHESSLNPIDVPRDWLWNLPRRMVYFGTSIPTIFKGLSQLEIQLCFWKGFVCVRGFDRHRRAPRPLVARLHFPASKLTRTRGRTDE